MAELFLYPTEINYSLLYFIQKGLVPDPVIAPAIRQSASGPTTAASPAAGKAPSAIKTNIKSANQLHPYGR